MVTGVEPCSILGCERHGMVVWFNAEGYPDDGARALSDILRRLSG